MVVCCIWPHNDRIGDNVSAITVFLGTIYYQKLIFYYCTLLLVILIKTVHHTVLNRTTIRVMKETFNNHIHQLRLTLARKRKTTNIQLFLQKTTFKNKNTIALKIKITQNKQVPNKNVNFKTMCCDTVLNVTQLTNKLSW